VAAYLGQPRRFIKYFPQPTAVVASERPATYLRQGCRIQKLLKALLRSLEYGNAKEADIAAKWTEIDLDMEHNYQPFGGLTPHKIEAARVPVIGPRSLTNRRKLILTDAMTVIEIKPHRWGWKAFEAPGVESVFSTKDDAIVTHKLAAVSARVRFACWIRLAT
jgi:hypothetical protein